MRSLLTAVAALVVVGGASSAAGQDLSGFLDNSPGPLARSHAEWDASGGCEKCHELGGGASGARCLDCHEDLKKLIRDKRGLHARVKKEKCTKCHTEHKGRTAQITSWQHVGGIRKFDHERTGFSLVGVHRDVACGKCHLRKLKTHRTSYIGLPPTCVGCHGNTHAFTSADLKGMCGLCHGEDGGRARKLKPKDLPFDHGERTGLALTDKHGKTECLKCHVKAKMSMKRKRKCADCHRKESPHGRAFRRSACNDCHKTSGWKPQTFSHEETRFPLRAKHATKRCSKCHKSAKKKPRRSCESCHKRTHRKRFKEHKCKSCHGLGGSNKIRRFRHEQRAGWALTGKHQALGCRDCHRGNKPWRFEKFESGNACRNCHSHKNAHRGEFTDKQCQDCHAEGGSKKLVFDHNKDSRFPLTGFHAELGQRGECQKCHPDQKFRTGKLDCANCHEDSHQGQLGTACDRCHKTEVKFDKIEFDHNRLSEFQIVGLHEKVECAKCHPERRYKTGKGACVDCHLEDDPHGEVLANDCETCHEPVKGAPKFVHNQMTDFLLVGAHTNTDCARCHQPPRQPPPKVGWTQTEPLGQLDLAFPKMGQVCAECHFDVHEGRYGPSCGSCHGNETFENVRPAHDTGVFRLMGRHDEIACGRCHTTDRLLTGLGPTCIECHQTDDAHNGGLGPSCGDCHQQFGWIPARFNHGTTGFVLRGAHRTAQCRDCHGIGVYAGLTQECSSCHLQEAMQVADPPHVPQMMDCQTCHVEITFSPARVFHPWHSLLGAHRTARCTSCHVQGTYTGTPKDCIVCHEVDYISPRNDPNHVAMGFSTDCTECHSQVTFKGGRAPPQ